MDEIKERINTACDYSQLPSKPELELVRDGEGYRLHMRFRNNKRKVVKRFISPKVDTRDMALLADPYIALWQAAVHYFETN